MHHAAEKVEAKRYKTNAFKYIFTVKNYWVISLLVKA